MNYAWALLLLILLLLIIVIFSKKFNKRLYFTIIFILTAIFTIGICTVKPQIHNQFSISIIDYILKFDSENVKGN